MQWRYLLLDLTCVYFRHFRKQYSEKSQERMSSKRLSKEVELATGVFCAFGESTGSVVRKAWV